MHGPLPRPQVWASSSAQRLSSLPRDQLSQGHGRFGGSKDNCCRAGAALSLQPPSLIPQGSMLQNVLHPPSPGNKRSLSGPPRQLQPSGTEQQWRGGILSTVREWSGKETFEQGTPLCPPRPASSTQAKRWWHENKAGLGSAIHGCGVLAK